MDLQEYIQIGRVGKAQGIKGEIRIIIYPGMPDGLDNCKEIVLQNNDNECSKYGLENFRRQGKHLIAKLDGVTTRDEAEALNGREIWLPRAAIPALDQDQHYWFEYEGMEVVTDTGRKLGVVQDIFATGANDVLVVVGQGKEYLIPIIEDVLVDVDVAAGKIVISPLPGLLDINN